MKVLELVPDGFFLEMLLINDESISEAERIIKSMLTTETTPIGNDHLELSVLRHERFHSSVSSNKVIGGCLGIYFLGFS